MSTKILEHPLYSRILKLGDELPPAPARASGSNAEAAPVTERSPKHGEFLAEFAKAKRLGRRGVEALLAALPERALAVLQVEDPEIAITGPRTAWDKYEELVRRRATLEHSAGAQWAELRRLLPEANKLFNGDGLTTFAEDIALVQKHGGPEGFNRQKRMFSGERLRGYYGESNPFDSFAHSIKHLNEILKAAFPHLPDEQLAVGLSGAGPGRRSLVEVMPVIAEAWKLKIDDFRAVEPGYADLVKELARVEEFLARRELPEPADVMLRKASLMEMSPAALAEELTRKLDPTGELGRRAIRTEIKRELPQSRGVDRTIASGDYAAETLNFAARNYTVTVMDDPSERSSIRDDLIVDSLSQIERATAGSKVLTRFELAAMFESALDMVRIYETLASKEGEIGPNARLFADWIHDSTITIVPCPEQRNRYEPERPPVVVSLGALRAALLATPRLYPRDRADILREELNAASSR